MANLNRAVTGSQFARFIIVGVLSTIVNYAIFIALLSVNTPYIVAMGAGFIAGTVAGFRINKVWTFGVARNEGGLFGAYVAVYAVSLLAGMGFLWALVELLLLDPRIANILTIGLTTMTNFVGTKLLVFKK
jgi:putative flippase GtrA